MTFTYSSTADPQTTLGKIRLAIGDTDSTAALFTDEEIDVYRDNRSDNILLVAADLCDVLATRYALLVTTDVGGQKIDYSNLSAAFAKRAETLRGQASGGQGLVSLDVAKVDGYSQDVASKDVTSERRRFAVGEIDAYTDLN